MVKPQTTDAGRRKIRCRNAVFSDTDSEVGVWCSARGMYIKPADWIDGVTCNNCCYRTPKDEWEVEPLSLGQLDGF